MDTLNPFDRIQIDTSVQIAKNLENIKHVSKKMLS